MLVMFKLTEVTQLSWKASNVPLFWSARREASWGLFAHYDMLLTRASPIFLFPTQSAAPHRPCKTIMGLLLCSLNPAARKVLNTPTMIFEFFLILLFERWRSADSIDIQCRHCPVPDREPRTGPLCCSG